MIVTYAFGLAALIGLLLAWTAVQRAWAREFPEAAPDGDALAGRRCDGCLICIHRCEEKDHPPAPGEPTRVEEAP